MSSSHKRAAKNSNRGRAKVANSGSGASPGSSAGGGALNTSGEEIEFSGDEGSSATERAGGDPSNVNATTRPTGVSFAVPLVADAALSVPSPIVPAQADIQSSSDVSAAATVSVSLTQRQDLGHGGASVSSASGVPIPAARAPPAAGSVAGPATPPVTVAGSARATSQASATPPVTSGGSGPAVSHAGSATAVPRAGGSGSAGGSAPPPSTAAPGVPSGSAAASSVVGVTHSGGAVSVSLAVGPPSSNPYASPLPVVNSSARDSALVRLRNGEYKRSAGDLKRFIAECADHLSDDELVDVMAALNQRRALSSPMLSPVPTPHESVVDRDPDPKIKGTCPVRDPSFTDFDGRGMFVDSVNSGVITAAGVAYNSDSPRWRLLGGEPLRSLAMGVFTTTTSPFSFNSELLRTFLLSQHSVYTEEKHELYTVPTRYLWSAANHLMRLGWLHDPHLFKSLAGAHFDAQGRSNELLLHPGHFFPGSSREEALGAYMEELDTRLTRGHEILLNLVTCLSGVFLAPDLLLEYKRLDMENKFFENSPRCSQEVLIGQFHRELQRCFNLLRRDMRDNGQETVVGSGVLLKSVFFDRGSGVAVWLMGRLCKSLEISPASGLMQARDTAVQFLRELVGSDRGRAPSPAPITSRSASPTPSGHVSSSVAPPSVGHATRPCVYSFLGKFCPGLGLKCAMGEACSFSHSFVHGGKSSKAVRSVVEGCLPTSILGSRKTEINDALDALSQ